jgi:hypothetical protein
VYSRSYISILIVGLLAIAVKGWGQTPKLEEWRAHLPYNTGIDIAQSDDKVYLMTEGGYYSVTKEEHSLTTHSKATGLSDVGVSSTAYSSEHRLLVIAYQNGNIDLVGTQEIINMPAIKQKNIPGGKSIHDIYFYQDEVYLSCSFGIVVIDLNRFEIKDTYKIGKKGGDIAVYDVAVYRDGVFAATEEGLKEAPLSANLSNFTNWSLHDNTQNTSATPHQGLAVVNDGLYADRNDSLIIYNDTLWQVLRARKDWKIKELYPSEEHLLFPEWKSDSTGISEVQLTILNAQHQFSSKRNSKLNRPLKFMPGKKNEYWVADLWSGLIRLKGESGETMRPKGPHSNEAFGLAAANGKVWVVSGAIDKGQFTFNFGGFYSFINNQWFNYNRFNRPVLEKYFDLNTITINERNDHIYMGSFAGGLVEFHNGEITTYGKQNSSLQGAIGDTARVKVTGIAIDENDNVWMSNYGVEKPISVKTNQGKWQAFKPEVATSVRRYGEMVIDDFSQKWVILPRNGILVFNHGDDITDVSDDQYAFLTKGEGNGNLPSNTVYSIARDREGNIWIGTSEGIGVFYCPGQVFNEGGCDAQRILVQQGEFNNYLMENEEVRAITVDGANRKWMATTNGTWLLSDNGKEEVYRFHEDNSPLLSNEMNDIAVDGQSGEVFFGTEKGIVSFRSTATEGEEEH